MPLIDSPPFDSIIVRGIAFEAARRRGRRRHRSRTPRRGRPAGRTSRPACSRGRSRARARRRRGRCGVSRSRSRALTSTGNGESSGSSSGSQLGGDGIPCSLEEEVREVLVRRAAARSPASGSRTSASSTSRRSARTRWSRSVSGTTSRTSCVVDQVGERLEVRRVVDPRHDRARVARGRAPARAGSASTAIVRAPARRERRDDVDALPGAGEEDGGHRHQSTRWTTCHLLGTRRPLPTACS